MSTVEDLDSDIHSLQARLATLHAHRSNLASILLSQPHLSTRLQTIPNSTAAKAISTQHARNLTNIHRACVGVTAYKVQDPDPNALNNGNILGISIDVALVGKFIDTYHVLLTWRASSTKQNVLRIHKHTIPPCIPLQPLANKWLPTAGRNGDEEEQVHQDLVRFGRSLRKELVAWHLRVRAITSLEHDASLADVKARQGGHTEQQQHTVLNAFTSDDDEEEAISDTQDRAHNGPAKIIDIDADHAVRRVSITWSDGRTAVVSVRKDGRVEKAVCRMRGGARDLSMARKALGPIGGLVRRLKA